MLLSLVDIVLTTSTDAFRGYTAYARVHGPEQALKIIQNEKLVLAKVDEFVKKHEVECDFHYTTTFDVCMTEEFAKYEAESFDSFKQAGGDVSHIQFYQGKEAKRRTRVPGAISAYEWPAGSSHPAKLAQFLLKTVVTKGAKLYTHCPALGIEKGTHPELWVISTPRGSLTASTVIHCTNAHSSYLLPQLSKFVTPNRAQAHTVVPRPSFSGENILTKTFSLRYSLLHFYSLIQRQDDGTMVLGVSRSNPNLSAKAKASIVSTDDGFYSAEICEDALASFHNIYEDGEEVDGEGKGAHGEGLDHAWTGIIAMTTDSVPLVGAVEGMPGHWICAGHNGHGMARIFSCAPGLAKLVMGGTWEDTGLPECFQMSNKRLEGLAGITSQSVW